MLGEYRIVVVTPAGRKLLIPQIQGLKPYVDEYRLWVNTDNADDIEYMKRVASEDPDFIKMEHLSRS